MSTPERNVGTLVHPAEYLHQLNSIASLTTERVVFLKRKFVSKVGWELVTYPLNEVSSIAYAATIPLWRIVGGVVLVALIGAILYFLGVYWDSLEPGQRIPVGAIAVAGFYGVKLLFGGRQHKLVVALQSGTRLTWKSDPGQFKAMQPVVDNIVRFANQKTLLKID